MDLNQRDCQTCGGPQFEVLRAVSDAIVSHRDLPSLFSELVGRLRRFVPFDYIVLVLHDAATKTMRLHVAGTIEPVPTPEIILPLEDDPAGLVWQTQQPLMLANESEIARWPRLSERARPYGVQSICFLPLTTARSRLGALTFSSKQPSIYSLADVSFLQLVANQVAIAVENARAFQELSEIKNKLAREKAYLEEEIRSEHFKGMVAVSDALREALKNVETVAPTDSTVLVLGETGTGKERIARALHDLSPPPRTNIRQT
jgi:formate hydrogenlyase transcriptional activator